MWIFNSVFGKIFDFIFFLFRSMNPWIGMILISVLTALLMLFVFRFTSNQEGIKRVKNKIKAHLLELRLFKDSMSLSFKAQGNILRYNLRYISYSTKPMLVMIIPLILILIQLNFWFGYEALTPGQETILKVKLEEGHNPLDIDISLEPSSGFDIQTPPLRIEEEREINWRLQAREKGVHDLTFIVNGQKFTKKVSVAQRPLSKISPLKVKRNFINELINPGESPFPGDSPIKAIEVKYQSKDMNLFGWSIPWLFGIPPWLVVYFALSIILGFVLKGIFKVQI
ncbi:hypothetical protein LCGC14_1405220 [marine sediment metagenome]|uniref:ResB-like domain-containing protein n=1 Tax=marine sediment metagenome TaxID=412755 RepID=A0A0F9JVV5_9ZZZZ|nr:hypothetical protein [Candidatus Aminicenantes bacterium]